MLLSNSNASTHSNKQTTTNLKKEQLKLKAINEEKKEKDYKTNIKVFNCKSIKDNSKLWKRKRKNKNKNKTKKTKSNILNLKSLFSTLSKAKRSCKLKVKNNTKSRYKYKR